MTFKQTSRSQQGQRAEPAKQQQQGQQTASTREEDLSSDQARVVSIGYVEQFRFEITGEQYDEWMPRIARSEDGLIAVLPCVDMDNGDNCLFIIPGPFRTWLRKQGKYVGLKLILRNKGRNPDTGSYNLTVERL